METRAPCGRIVCGTAAAGTKRKDPVSASADDLRDCTEDMQERRRLIDRKQPCELERKAEAEIQNKEAEGRSVAPGVDAPQTVANAPSPSAVPADSSPGLETFQIAHALLLRKMHEQEQRRHWHAMAFLTLCQQGVALGSSQPGGSGVPALADRPARLIAGTKVNMGANYPPRNASQNRVRRNSKHPQSIAPLRNNKATKDTPTAVSKKDIESAKASAKSGAGGGVKSGKFIVPLSHDVLLGRGAGVNSHPGNRRFREWVNERKERYILAPSKTAKAVVAREIIDLVRGPEPQPGRFLRLIKNSCPGGGGRWAEVSAEKVLAKTSQALREGAPDIRLAHGRVILHAKEGESDNIPLRMSDGNLIDGLRNNREKKTEETSKVCRGPNEVDCALTLVALSPDDDSTDRKEVPSPELNEEESYTIPSSEVERKNKQPIEETEGCATKNSKEKSDPDSGDAS